MKLTTKQNDFLTLASMGKNIYLSGKAGTGKSTVVKQFIENAKKENLKIACLATTGVAAQNIGGQTIHSFFGIGFGKVLTIEDLKFMRRDKKDMLRKVAIVIIDEVSMLRPDVLDAIKNTYSKNRIKISNVQFIFIGDLAQLPPAISQNEEYELQAKYGGTKFYNSEFFKELQTSNIDLDEVVRQSDHEFIENLNIIRDGGKSEYFKKFVSTEPKGIVIAPHNDTVNKYNQQGLNSIEGKEIHFMVHAEGKAKPSDFNLDEKITVKEGARIMYLSNNREKGLINGTIGYFTSINNKPHIKVDGQAIEIETITFKKSEYVLNSENKLDQVVVGTVKSLPIKLAYAVTIHKSQGLTFDEVTIDLTKPCFQKGQLYTALSRVKSPEGLRLILK